MNAAVPRRYLLVASLLVYTAAMLALVWHYRQDAKAERARAASVAAGMERLLSLLGPSATGATLEALRKRPDVIAVEEFPKDARALLRDGQRAFTVVFSDAKLPRWDALG